MRRVEPFFLMTHIDNLLHLGDAAGEGGVGLIDMEAVFFEHDLDLIPSVVQLCTRYLDF